MKSREENKIRIAKYLKSMWTFILNIDHFFQESSIEIFYRSYT